MTDRDPAPPSRLLIMGLGNPLMADDGAGYAVTERLVQGDLLPPGVRASWGETDVLRLVGEWRGEPSIWLVDALYQGLPPGTVTCLEHRRLLAVKQRHQSAHRLSVAENLRWIGLAYPEMTAVEYRLWGIEPASLTARPSLSPEVARSVDHVARDITAAACRLVGRV